MTDYSALVVGAGPTGLAMATDLLRQGVRVRLIDVGDGPTTLSKATTIMPRTLEELAIRGLADRVIELGNRVNCFNVFHKGAILFKPRYQGIDSPFNFLINIPQYSVESVFREELERLGGTIEHRTKLLHYEEVGDCVEVTIQTADGEEKTERVDYLLGTDGAHSTARHGLDVEFVGNSYKDVWMLADVNIEWRMPRDQSYAFFTETSLMAVFPMPEDRWRIYIIRPGEQELGRDPTLDEIIAAAQEATHGAIDRISDPVWLAEFHCHHRRTSSYSQGRVFLCGDAAHIHSPESGLGLNTGVQDAFNLSWKIADVVNGHAAPSLLDTYHSERSYVGKQVVGLSDMEHQIWARFDLGSLILRDRIWTLINKLYTYNVHLLEVAAGLNFHYKRSAWLRDKGHPYHAVPGLVHVVSGTRAHDGRLLEISADGTQTWHRLFEKLDATRHTLLVLAGDNEHHSEAKVRQVLDAADRFGGRVQKFVVTGSHLLPSTAAAFGAPVYFDPAMDLHYFYASMQGAIILIRPDGYVAYTSRPVDAKDFSRWIDSLDKAPTRAG